jgi:hypothetical protein
MLESDDIDTGVADALGWKCGPTDSADRLAPTSGERCDEQHGDGQTTA